MAHMSPLSFKARDDFKRKIEALAEYKGINLSACIKLLLTEALHKELSRITENDMTVATEIEILESEKDPKVYGPFTTVEELMKSLNKKK